MALRPPAMLTLPAFLFGVTGTALAQSPTSLSFSPTTVEGDQTSTGQVSLSAAAPANGLVVGLTSSNPSVAMVPLAVSALPGATAVSFTVTTFPVAPSTTVTITASAGGVTGGRN